MSKVLKLGITSNNNKKIEEVDSIKVLANKGIVGDRHFDDYNDPYCQLSLIESENIDYYNTKFGLNIPYIDFRRNIITKGIKLNDLIGKKLLIEDAHVNLDNVLNLFDNILIKDDYLIVEDSDAKQEILRDFAIEKEPKYKLDQFFLDFFGKNITCSRNSIFKVFE